MGIRLGPPPPIDQPAHRALVLEIHALLTGSRFATLTALGDSLRPRRSSQRLSELARGGRLPDLDELRALVAACDPRAGLRLAQLLADARAERSAAAATPVPQLSDYAHVRTTGRLPIVAESADWVTLRVHRPITRLSTGTDLTDRVIVRLSVVCIPQLMAPDHAARSREPKPSRFPATQVAWLR
jgi:hypothetical protein